MVFEYEGGPCPIYEEFTFNDSGGMTFIEAWSNLPKYLPMDPDQDPWAENGIPRLSTRVPGLGNEQGLIDLDGERMSEVAAKDEDVAELQRRARDQWKYWLDELNAADEDFFAQGCGW